MANEFLGDLEDTFRKRARREPTDFDLYVLWNAGPSYYAKVAFSATRVHPIIRERAQRYVNLCRMNNGPAATAPPATPAKVAPSPAPPPSAQPAPTLAQTLSAPLAPVHFPALQPVAPRSVSSLLAAIGTDGR